MAVRLKKLQGSDIPEEHRHLGDEEVFQVVTADTIRQFVDELNVSDAVKAELRAITPFTYTGL